MLIWVSMQTIALLGKRLGNLMIHGTNTKIAI